jgi:hypothetical protein
MDTNITIVIIYPDKEIIIENKDISVWTSLSHQNRLFLSHE